jgi:DNA-directed RNA polymerase specialized sigma24 family protein
LDLADRGADPARKPLFFLRAVPKDSERSVVVYSVENPGLLPFSRGRPMNDNPPETCVTEWLGRLKAGDPNAAGRLWDDYFPRLIALALNRLRAAPRAAEDEEDVAAAAFASFCRGVQQGRFPKLNDRADLWQVLSVLTQRKAVNLARREARTKRGGGRVVHASTLEAGDDRAPVDGVSAHELEPQLAALVTEECRRLLELLGDESLRRIALWKMEGYTNAEIAVKLGRVEGTVERKLALIRARWEGEGKA